MRSAVADEFTDNPKQEVRSDANPPLTWDTGTRLFAGRQYFAKVRAFYPVTGLDASTGTDVDIESGQWGIWSGFSDEVAFTTEEDAPDPPQAPSYEDDLGDTYRKTRSTELWTELGYNGGAEVKVVTLIRDENYGDSSTQLNFDCPGESGCYNAKLTNGASCVSVRPQVAGVWVRDHGDLTAGYLDVHADDSRRENETDARRQRRVGARRNVHLHREGDQRRWLLGVGGQLYDERRTSGVCLRRNHGMRNWKRKHGLRTWRSVGRRGHVQRDSRPARGADVRRGDHVVDHGEVDCARVRQRGGLGKGLRLPLSIG